jgi:raffinose/stachyose/melibiose transport system permease protein
MLAFALNSQIKSKSLLRLVFFAPVIITPVVVANIWKFIFLPDVPLNQLLTAVGLENPTHSWLDEEAAGSTRAMLIYLAGRQNVPTQGNRCALAGFQKTEHEK